MLAQGQFYIWLNKIKQKKKVVVYMAHPRVHERRLHPLVDTCSTS